MNIVDSSGWLAYFADEINAKHFVIPLSDPTTLIVPAITLYEVFKVILREAGENESLQAIVAMQKGKVIDLNTTLALSAARLSLEHRLPMADSIILATAHEFKATIWTQDVDFKDIAEVKYFPKTSEEKSTAE